MRVASFDGMAKPMPEAGAPPKAGFDAPSVGMPMTRPLMSTSAPPLLPGLIGALVWIRLGSEMPLPSWPVRPRALTMPLVTELERPSGLPMASAIWPTCSRALLAKVAGAGLIGIEITARSLAGKLPTRVPATWRPFESVTLKLVAVPTTCAFVTMWPLRS